MCKKRQIERKSMESTERQRRRAWRAQKDGEEEDNQAKGYK